MSRRPVPLPNALVRGVAALGVAALVVAVLASGAAAATKPAAMRNVVREWSRLLNAGDYAAMARLFRLPTIVEQGGVGYRLKTAKHIALWHDGLPCGGTVTQITIRGRVATVVFALSERKGHRCDAPGELAAADFEIVDGRIVHWTQVAVPAGAKKPATGPAA
jgi:limonene-1,2-epoxide hydrolase